MPPFQMSIQQCKNIFLKFTRFAEKSRTSSICLKYPDFYVKNCRGYVNSMLSVCKSRCRMDSFKIKNQIEVIVLIVLRWSSFFSNFYLFESIKSFFSLQFSKMILSRSFVYTSLLNNCSSEISHRERVKIKSSALFWSVAYMNSLISHFFWRQIRLRYKYM